MDGGAMTLPDPVQLAIPAFVVLCVVEALWAWRRKTAVHGFDDSAASLAMGLGNVAIAGLHGLWLGGFMAWIHQFRVFEIGFVWWAFPAILVAEDFAYYWFHRLSHERRLWWAAHVNHHSSKHYNLTTALRQSWTTELTGAFLIWTPLALIGFPPALIAFQKGISLVYQFWIHTELIRRMGSLEAVLNTPSHHRVHHSRNVRYLDANYGGIFIVWDRLFGTFVREDDAEPCRYGLVRDIVSFNPLTIAFHEWRAMGRDLRAARNWRERFGYVFGPPGWSPDGSRKTSRDLKRERDAGTTPPNTLSPAE